MPHNLLGFTVIYGEPVNLEAAASNYNISRYKHFRTLRQAAVEVTETWDSIRVGKVRPGPVYPQAVQIFRGRVIPGSSSRDPYATEDLDDSLIWDYESGWDRDLMSSSELLLVEDIEAPGRHRFQRRFFKDMESELGEEKTKRMLPPEWGEGPRYYG